MSMQSAENHYLTQPSHRQPTNAEQLEEIRIEYRPVLLAAVKEAFLKYPNLPELRWVEIRKNGTDKAFSALHFLGIDLVRDKKIMDSVEPLYQANRDNDQEAVQALIIEGFLEEFR